MTRDRSRQPVLASAGTVGAAVDCASGWLRELRFSARFGKDQRGAASGPQPPQRRGRARLVA